MTRAGEITVNADTKAASILRGDAQPTYLRFNGVTYVPEDRWQDISSAPKDGTRFLAAEPEDGWIIGPCVWCKTPHIPLYGFHFTEGDPEGWDIAHPTHWMPLPTPPSQEDSA